MISPEDPLQSLMALARRASPGPWALLGCKEYHDGTDHSCVTTRTADRMKCDSDADMAFKAAANPAVVIALLERLSAAEAVVEAARGYELRYGPQSGVLPDPLATALDAFDRVSACPNEGERG